MSTYLTDDSAKQESFIQQVREAFDAGVAGKEYYSSCHSIMLAHKRGQECAASLKSIDSMYDL